MYVFSIEKAKRKRREMILMIILSKLNKYERLAI